MPIQSKWSLICIQSDQQETKSRVLPHLLFYRNVRRILIRHFYIIAMHSFCWLPTSQKSIINYYLLLIKEKTHSYIKFLHKARNLWLQNFKSLFFRILCFVVFCKKSAKVIILTF
jgi:hypothetical protein